ncbi:EamA family transporter RarD [Corynebacterium sp. A21]|uniref:EamA family transporter RarD n=1 Tax=Corynebacterium sp. A21 TaxID=3457318 RepID=UPI003FD49318
MVYGVLAYLIWGIMPAFFPLLLPAGPVEILAHRVVWAGIIMIVVVTLSKGWGELRKAGARSWAWMCLAGVLIALNWLIYIIAVNSAHVSDAALGYFINPLFSVVLGMLFFGERLRRNQVIAVAIAALGVIFLTFLGGQLPILALSLTLTFGIYGAIKKQVKISAVGSLTAETLVLMPFALGYIFWLESSGEGTFLTEGPTHIALLIGSGLITAVPLLCFGIGARRLPLSTIGMLQYLTPTMQMLWAVFVVSETIEPGRWGGFLIIWTAVAIYLFDLVRQRRQQKRVPPA